MQYEKLLPWLKNLLSILHTIWPRHIGSNLPSCCKEGWRSGAVTTLGRGGSDLTATSIGRALGLQEIQVRSTP
uniref:Aspartokinase 1, chloroplastic n=1 Tax=Vitis vinifera TaxID=29760 RepID=F6HW51_VITVI